MELVDTAALVDASAQGQADRDIRLIRLAFRDLEEVNGIGKKSATALREMGIDNVYDLISFYPRTYRDRSKSTTIDELVEGHETTIFARVTSVELQRLRNRRTLVKVELADESGTIRCSFFNQPWRAKQLQPDCEVFVAGKPVRYKSWLTLSNPIVDIIGKPGSRRTGRVVAIYPQSDKAGISTWDIETWIREILRRTGEVSDPMPTTMLKRNKLVDRNFAIKNIHIPESMDSCYLAKRRLIFDEMLRLQLCLMERKDFLEKNVLGIAHAPEASNPSSGRLVDKLIETLSFDLTNAQLRAINEIRADMARPIPMHRLVQGDVGSGKTLVALCSMLVAAEGGHQGALLVPTEILAEQHFSAIRNLVGELSMPDSQTLTGERPYRIELLTSSTKLSERNKILDHLKIGRIDCVVGTHSLLSEDVKFSSLGLVIVDEQHRFGVDQRDVLRSRRGDDLVPDLLVMTATPIPRTVAMTVFGDLDTTIIDELPPGRIPIETIWLRDDESAAWERVREQVELGFQAYVVCPLVGESSSIAARAAREEHYRLCNGPLKDISVGLVHGQMAAREKEASMQAYRKGVYSVLVSTTVIEVGVDVPNANVIVIEDAWRFGIAQLHQLRGRVGRGGEKSWCFLLGDPGSTKGSTLDQLDELDESSKAAMRLKAMCDTNDGFALAEQDLLIRGEGSVTGSFQSGKSALKLGSVIRDRQIVEQARTAAQLMISQGWRRDKDSELGAEIDYLIEEAQAGFLTKG